jgi:hypothetical protein
MDLGKEENEVAFKKDMSCWMEVNANKNMKRYGYVDITSVSGVAYGTACQ